MRPAQRVATHACDLAFGDIRARVEFDARQAGDPPRFAVLPPVGPRPH